MTPETEFEQVETELINRQETTQARACLDEAAICEYRDWLAAHPGEDLPPLDLFFDRGTGEYYIGDGWHRFWAYDREGREYVPAKVNAGSERKALIYALGANEMHGVRRTPADKRNAVAIALDDAEFSAWSAREVAELCSVSHKLVGVVRKELTPADSLPGDDSEAVPNMNSKRRATRDRIADALAATPGASDREIGKAAGCSPHTVAKTRTAGATGAGASARDEPPEAPKPPASGKEVVPVKARKEAKAGWGKVVRLIGQLGLDDELGEAAEMISYTLKEHWGGGL
jgi:uncharacterized ParB-like nuclease family protein